MKIESNGLHFAVLVESLCVRNSKLNTAILIEVSVAFLSSFKCAGKILYVRYDKFLPRPFQ